jgi:hypothetical protein
MRMLAIFFLGMCIMPAHGQEQSLSDKEKTAWNNVQQELTKCVVFFQFGKTCAPDDATPESVARVSKMIDYFDAMAIEVGNRIGMTEDAMQSRLKMELDEQNKLLQGSCVNYPSLMERHIKQCKIVGEHPEQVYFEYLNGKH